MRVYLCVVKVLSVGLLVPFMAAAAPAKTKGIDPALLAKAKAGDATAQCQIGLDYDNGDGVPQDYAKAASWYRKAADQGYAVAQYDLGDLFLFGKGVPIDYAQGITWFRKAAEQGNPSAQTDLARFYLIGKYVPQDYALALSWYRKAAERGNPDGQAALASLYENGRGVRQDYSEAYFWMSLAAANRDLAGAYRFLSTEHAKDRDRIAARLSNTELLKVQKKARVWSAAHQRRAQIELKPSVSTGK